MPDVIKVTGDNPARITWRVFQYQSGTINVQSNTAWLPWFNIGYSCISPRHTKSKARRVVAYKIEKLLRTSKKLQESVKNGIYIVPHNPTKCVVDFINVTAAHATVIPNSVESECAGVGNECDEDLKAALIRAIFE